MTTAVIGSPYQLLGLAEAAAAGVVDRPHVLYLGDTGEVAALLGEVGDLFAGVRQADPLALARAAARSGTLVVGDLHSRVGQTLLIEPTVSRVVVLEDGAATYRALRAVAAGDVIPRRAHHDRSSWARRAVATARLTRLARQGRATVVAGATLTERLSADLAATGFEVVQHGFVRTRRTLPAIARGRHVRRLVMGSALAADGLVDAQAYAAWLGEQLADVTSWHLPHRRERADRVRGTGRVVDAAGLPAELVVQAMPNLAEVVTLPSTVALTVPRCVPAPVDVRVAPVPRAWWRLDGPAPRLLAEWIAATAADRTGSAVASAVTPGSSGAATNSGRSARASTTPST